MKTKLLLLLLIVTSSLTAQYAIDSTKTNLDSIQSLEEILIKTNVILGINI